eukprot:CAMPEP_0179915246 /NCGR_PEP_ID=MMETSP0983-20121128/1559_1 /TAXON_ID=483367 /ORGANISM="non described non described, Strain CCMP 2436" /LENGTH=47 /DNA_ID= /DNA_START= /DNA_END= /DNA_ORIENTATION=
MPHGEHLQPELDPEEGAVDAEHAHEERAQQRDGRAEPDPHRPLGAER